MSLNSKMTALANSIRAKSGALGLLGLDAMKLCVDSIVTPASPESYSQVNAAVESYLSYLSEHPYDPDDYTVSHVAPFALSVSNGDRPLGKTLTLSAGKLFISDSLGGTELRSVSAGTQTIYNVAPTSDGGSYISTNAYGDILACGRLLPTGALRMIYCPNARNVRDLGGWDCDGGTVKYGKIIRGGVPNVSDRGVLVDSLGIKAVIDLRGSTEAQNAASSALGTELRYFLYDSYAWYSLQNKALWKKMLCDLFDCVKKAEPVYINCSAGADRTGTFALIVEALLGVSQSDCDADYELSCFYTGSDTDANARRRNESDWTGLIDEIGTYTGATFRDKVINFVQTCGISIDDINAFRAAMINGTPEHLYSTLGRVSITENSEHISSDIAAETLGKCQPFEACITADKGYLIDSVEVLMGGVDVTNDAWSGVKENRLVGIETTLSNCYSDVSRSYVIAGQMYYANISAAEGYTLDGATVSISMGGINVSAYYSEGKISIPNVSGNLVINISAVPTVSPNLWAQLGSRSLVTQVVPDAALSQYFDKSTTNHTQLKIDENAYFDSMFMHADIWKIGGKDESSNGLGHISDLVYTDTTASFTQDVSRYGIGMIYKVNSGEHVKLKVSSAVNVYACIIFVDNSGNYVSESLPTAAFSIDADVAAPQSGYAIVGFAQYNTGAASFEDISIIIE